MFWIFMFVLIGSCFSMRQQSVAVRGQLLCGERPAVGVKVKLWDEDDDKVNKGGVKNVLSVLRQDARFTTKKTSRYLGPDPDDALDEMYTDMNGNFRLQGSTRELTNIDPVLKVYHDCDDGIKPGQRKLKFYIPDHYISSGGRPRKIFNLGTLNLETIFKCEERDLL